MMRQIFTCSGLLLFAAPTLLLPSDLNDGTPLAVGAESAGISDPYAGTASCRECHENFYQLWAPSQHGLAMQPFTMHFASRELILPSAEFEVGGSRFQVVLAEEAGWVQEEGPAGEQRHRIQHAMGGKNVYFFLTELERGHLQVLPLAYDVGSAEWYDTTASMLRHFSDEAVSWRDRSLTFNTSCHSCHVSQISTNYDLATDSYQTVWAEPGINCETCHGPGEDHIRAFRAAGPGETLEDPRIIRTGEFDAEQTNTMCGVCHAVMVPLTTSYMPGERFFDHFNLTALESPDFYPDGRDLGENYTETLWHMNPCVQSGQLDCMHCHTSSGRFRFADDPNQACAACHSDRVASVAEHSRHAADSAGSQCIACHMPRTEFAGMERSDHSLLPPTPATTVAHGSPNACTICHSDQSAEWADRLVREWHGESFQQPIMHRAGLIAAARDQDWSRLPEMLAYLEDETHDPVFAASLIRLLQATEDDRKVPALLSALEDPSPLVRSAAAAGLSQHTQPDVLLALLRATEDEYRVVRINAASSLAPLPMWQLNDEDRRRLSEATDELMTSFAVRPDDWASHYNRGNFHLGRDEIGAALAAYDIALRLNPDAVPALVNAAMAWSRTGSAPMAEALLTRARELEPTSSTVHFNLGLLQAELGNPEEAEASLRAALESDPELAPAALNLGILIAEDRLDEAIHWCRRAHELRPRDSRYAETLAHYLRQSGNGAEADRILEALIAPEP